MPPSSSADSPSGREHVEPSSVELYNSIFLNAPVGIFQSTPDGRILLANPVFIQMLGYQTLEDVQRLDLGRDVYVHAEDRARMLAQHIHGRDPWTVDLLWKRLDRTAFVVRLTTHGVWDQAGALRYFESFAQDVTDARRAEDERGRALSLLSTTIEATADGILVVDREGNLVRYNQTFLEMWRMPEDVAKSRDTRVRHALYQVQDPRGFAAKIAHLYASPEEVSFDVLEFKDGRVIERVSMPHWLDEECVGRVVTFRDVTDQRRDERIKTRLLHQLISAQEAERRRLAQELHDETSQALTSLLVGLRSIQEAPRLAGARETAQALRAIAAETLENVGRLAQGLHPSVLDDLGFLPALTRYVHDHATLYGIRIEIDAGGLGNARLPQPIEMTLYRVALEAITNAVRHAKPRNLHVAVSRSQASVSMVVLDDGVGFDLEHERVPTNNHLGLYGIRERVALLGGKATVRSAPGHGTTVTVEIPLGA